MIDKQHSAIDLDNLRFDVEISEITTSFDFERLRRWPEPESTSLQAFDATDTLILDLAATLVLSNDALFGGKVDPQKIVVLNENFGAVSLPLARFARDSGKKWNVIAWSDSISRERAVSNNANNLEVSSPVAISDSLEEVLGDAVVILIQAPRSHSELHQMIETAHRVAGGNAVVLVGGRVKYLTTAVNDLLGRYFSEVRASRARAKSRVIVANVKRDPVQAKVKEYPRIESHEVHGVNLLVAAYGATFGGAKIDPGTRFFLETLPKLFSRTDLVPHEIVDLGCGNGTISAFVASKFKEFEGQIIATDSSRDAVLATAETARLNQLSHRIRAVRDDAMSRIDDESHDLILLNPPFHVGNTVDPNIAVKLFKASARVLKENGELWCVWNSHLHYKGELNRLVGPTTEIARNRKFTITRTIKVR